jgi:AsmA family/AsmA-like C-terminal region
LRKIPNPFGPSKERLFNTYVDKRLSAYPTSGIFVKRVVKHVVIVIASLACLAGLALLAINLYVQSPGTQMRLRKAASESLGYPLSVFRISFVPFDGFHFQDVTIENPATGKPLMKAHDLKIACAYLPLLRKKLIIREIVLTGADLRIPRRHNREPQTVVPESAAAPQIHETPSAKPSPTLSVRAPQTETPHPKTLQAPKNFWVEIRKFKIKQSAICLMAPDDTPEVALRDVDCSLWLHKGEYLGKLHISGVTLSDSFNFEDASSMIRCSTRSIDLSDLTASISGGDIHGHFHVDLTQPDRPYQLKLEVARVNVNEVMNRAGGILDRAHGALEGKFELSGSFKDASQAVGDGNLEIKEGYLDQYPVLQEIGRWTQIDELQRLRLEQALSKFSVHGQTIKVDSVQLISKNCQVDIWGAIDTAQRLALNGRLTVSQFLSQKIPNELEENFQPASDGHSRFLDFQITGTLAKPQTDLFERLVGDRTKLFKRLLHGNRKDRRKDRSTSETTPKEPRPEE